MRAVTNFWAYLKLCPNRGTINTVFNTVILLNNTVKSVCLVCF